MKKTGREKLQARNQPKWNVCVCVRTIANYNEQWNATENIHGICCFGKLIFIGYFGQFLPKNIKSSRVQAK